MSIGKTLREKREERKLSVAQISSVIRINKKYLQALEDENFLLIPSLVYAKGFLKAYSEYLGVDPKGLLSELTIYFKAREEGRNVIPEPKAPKNISIPKMPNWNVELKMPRLPKIDLSFKMLDLSKMNFDIRMPKLPQMPKLPDMPKPPAMPKFPKIFLPKINFNIVKNAIKLAGILIILFIVVMLVSKQASFYLKRTMLIKANPPAAAKIEAQDRSKANPAGEAAVPSGRIEVKVQAVGRAMVNVSSGSKELFSGTVQPGTKLRFIGREVKVITDNGGAIKMIVGGNPLGLMGENGVAVERTYKASE